MAELAATNTIVHLENMTIEQVSELFVAAGFDFFYFSLIAYLNSFILTEVLKCVVL